MDNFQEFLLYDLGSNTVKQYLMAFAMFLGLLILFKLFISFVLMRLKILSSKTKGDFDNLLVEIIEKIPFVFFVAVALYFPFRVLVANPSVEKVVWGVFLVLFVFQIIQIVMKFVEYWLGKYSEVKGRNKEEVKASFSGLIIVIKLILWISGFLLILSNLGVNITSLVASLGIGGIAVALAAQNILADVFSSFSIYFDKPFEVGDYIKIGKDMGTVKKIGLKTTRIDTPQGQELVVSNQELTSSRVENFKKMKKRRVVVNFGVDFGTSNEKLKKVHGLIENVVKTVKDVEFDRVHFSEFAHYGFMFEFVYYVLSSEYPFFMDKKEEINLALKETLEKENIKMAMPEQAIVMPGV